MSAWLLTNRREETRRRLWMLFWLGHLPMVYLVTGGFGGALVLIAAAYIAIWQPVPTDKTLALLISAVTSLTWVGSYFIMGLWKLGEVWSLTGLVVEHPRVAGFIYFPLYLILGRFCARLLLDARPGADIWLLISALAINALWSPVEPYGTFAVLVLCWLSVRQNSRLPRWWPALNGGGAVAAMVFSVGSRFSLTYVWQSAVVLGLLTCVAWGLWFVLETRLSQRFAYLALVVGGLAVLFGATVLRPTASDLLAVRVLRASSWPALKATDLATGPLRLAQWAQANTAPESLFYFDGPDFRFRARRSITHAWTE